MLGPRYHLHTDSAFPSFYDQRLALDWVQRNIQALEGDPASITIFGQASGATWYVPDMLFSCPYLFNLGRLTGLLISLDNFITTLPNNPPFRAAILQSGQAAVYGSVTNGTVAWDALAKQLNCSTQSDVLKCVRGANATDIISILEHSNLDFTPVKDNITELQDPESARLSGNVARVPLLTGTVAQEGTVERKTPPVLYYLLQMSHPKMRWLVHLARPLLTLFLFHRIWPRQYDRVVDGDRGKPHDLYPGSGAGVFHRLNRQWLAHQRRL